MTPRARGDGVDLTLPLQVQHPRQLTRAEQPVQPARRIRGELATPRLAPAQVGFNLNPLQQ